MDGIVAFLRQKYYHLLFVLLLCVGVWMYVAGNAAPRSVWQSSATAVVGQMNTWRSAITAYTALREMNTLLTERNFQLEYELYTLRSSLAETAVDSVPMNLVGTIPAHVVQNDIRHKDNLLTIDKGRADGVRANMGVVSGTGVVGIVYLVGDHYSVVLPLLNSRSNISCVIGDTNYFGYLSWTGKDTRHAYMEDVPRYARYKKGESVLTSGFSAVFPRGLQVGTVVATYNSADGLSYRVKVLLSADFASLYDVFVVDNTAAQEQLELLRMAKDSIAQ